MLLMHTCMFEFRARVCKLSQSCKSTSSHRRTLGLSATSANTTLCKDSLYVWVVGSINAFGRWRRKSTVIEMLWSEKCLFWVYKDLPEANPDILPKMISCRFRSTNLMSMQNSKKICFPWRTSDLTHALNRTVERVGEKRLRTTSRVKA